MSKREHNGSRRRVAQVQDARIRTADGAARAAKGGKGTERRSLGREAVENRQPKVVVSLVLALIIFLLGCIQLLSTAHTYMTNLNELNANKELEAQLTAQKADLENDIARWGDKAYVVAQARDRLGFVFPNEKSVRVLHPEAVTGGSEGEASASGTKDGQSVSKLPWYEEMAYSFKEADEKPLNEQQDVSSTGAKDNKGNGVSSQGSDARQGASSGDAQDGNGDQADSQSDNQTNGEESQQ